MKKDEKKPQRQGEKSNPEIIDTTWKPEPVTNASLNMRGFRFSLGVTLPPRRRKDEPLQ